MKEKVIEDFLVVSVKRAGGECLKVEAIRRGFPDRMCIFPNGSIIFVELKAPNKKPRTSQVYELARLKKLNCKVYVVDSKEQVLEIIRRYAR